MSLRDENLLRPVRDDQCRCRRCAAPILLSTAKRHQGKCTPCSVVPRWIYVFGIYRRTTVFIVALIVAAVICFHVWNLYGWVVRWRETFMTHPILYSISVFLTLLSMLLLVHVFKIGKQALQKRSTEMISETENLY